MTINYICLNEIELIDENGKKYRYLFDNKKWNKKRNKKIKKKINKLED